MAIATNSYGSAVNVAALTPRWATSAGLFDEGTKPTIATVEAWIDQVSGILNAILSDNRFSIPVTQGDAVSMLDLFVNQEVAALVEGSHSGGRFGPTAKSPTGGRFDLIFTEVEAFVRRMAGGLEAMGASRGTSQTNVGSVALTRADGYSNDLNAVEASQL